MKFLKLDTYEEAIKKIEDSVSFELKSEDTPISSSLNRILSEDLISPINVPHYPKSQMDGYAVRSEDTFEASETSPVKLKLIESVNAGSAPRYFIKKNNCSYVATGAPVPEGADSVVMIENTQLQGKYIALTRGVTPGENIMKVGYDIKKGKRILPKNTLVTPKVVGLLSGLGLKKVKVYRKLKIGIFSTGNEIITPWENLDYGKTYDVNSFYITSKLEKLGCDTYNIGIAKDSKEDILSKLNEAKKCDIIILSAGASKGERDFVEEAINNFGNLIIHGISIKPGKPTLVGLKENKLIFGLPGHPTSSFVLFNVLVLPFIYKMAGLEKKIEMKKFISSERIYSTRGRKDFLPVMIKEEEVSSVFRGSGAISSFLKAEGIAIIEENTEFVDKGEELEVIILED
ncbi:MAG: dehydrogenase FmdD [Candidatus Methanofastidiosum methylothiophilum]|uniref:Dehydrogenase FmdD n=1 Tax=Candidatus Methanofastidiosum methylothiophilum TaxID=1705564 RepID=A0A150J656_9EURY|nr:MAG: dehydrogenase FmdD [Candidatus Methanofastidiosum methylthiophilus]